MASSAAATAAAPHKGAEEEEEDVSDYPNDCSTAMKEDDPRQSAAALCISLRFWGQKQRRASTAPTKDNDYDESNILWYGPEFTHQIFDGEYIPGYQPFAQDVQQRMVQIHHSTTTTTTTSNSNANDNNKEAQGKTPYRAQHASHGHFDKAQEYLRIKVDISPSCTKCKVSFETEPITKKRVLGVVESSMDELSCTNKRHRLENDNDSASGNSGAVRFKEEEEEEKGDEPATVKDEKFDVSATKMPLEQVRERLSGMLPEIIKNKDGVDNGDCDNVIRSDFLKEPLGVVLHEYVKGGTRYFVSLASSAKGSKSQRVEVAKFHHAVQRLALGYIEAADDIDVTYQPHGGQYWQIVYLFKKHDTADDDDDEAYYSLAGYMTLWTVTSLLAKPTSGIVLRITQALILPHEQRRGHGQEMMRVIYQLAQGVYKDKLFAKTNKSSQNTPKDGNNVTSYDDDDDDSNDWSNEPIIQVNMEDPAPGITCLRNLVDYQVFWENTEWKKRLLDTLESQNTTKDGSRSSSSSMARYKFWALDSQTAEEMAALAKITPRQVQIVLELLAWRALQSQTRRHSQPAGTTFTNDDEDGIDLEKPFRLAVKERLYRENKSEIHGMHSKEEMRAKLAQLYEEQIQGYNRILEKVHGTSQ